MFLIVLLFYRVGRNPSAVSTRVLSGEQSTAQIFMKHWLPTCWEACQKLRDSNLYSISEIYRYIPGWFTHNETDKETEQQEKNEEKLKGKEKKLVCWCKDPVSSAVIFFGGQLVHRKQAGDDKGFVHGSNSHFIKGSCRKLKHDRSNTGLNAFSSFPIFPFQHICLVSALSRLCNGKLLQKHFSVSAGQGVITDVTLKVTSGK